MEARTVGGHDAYIYPKEPNDKTLKGCVILRSRYPWHTGENRIQVEWELDGKYISSARGRSLKNHDWDLLDEYFRS